MPEILAGSPCRNRSGGCVAVGLVAPATLIVDELDALALVLEGGVGEFPPAPLLALRFARRRLEDVGLEREVGGAERVEWRPRRPEVLAIETCSGRIGISNRAGRSRCSRHRHGCSPVRLTSVTQVHVRVRLDERLATPASTVPAAVTPERPRRRGLSRSIDALLCPRVRSRSAAAPRVAGTVGAQVEDCSKSEPDRPSENWA
jgi:hypothetical protein